MPALPEEIVNRYRRVTVERLDRCEAIRDQALASGQVTPAQQLELHRHLHTIKGDSSVMGFNDIARLAHKLEDLLEFALSEHSAIGEELDILVTMGFQFIGVLLRTRGAALGGIDVAGFVRQIDSILPREPASATGDGPDAETEMLRQQMHERFRRVAGERLERCHEIWADLIREGADPPLAGELHRHIQSLRGDALLIGVRPVAAICQRLRDLLAVVCERNYDIPASLHHVVGEAFQMVGRLIEKPEAGDDLAGFLRRLDGALRAQERAAERSGPVVDPATTRARMAAAAATALLESLQSRGADRRRFRRIWSDLRRRLVDLDAAPLAQILERQIDAAGDLAAHLGKQVDLQVDLGELRVAAEAVEPIAAVVLHGMRNALDHGIETGAERAAAGKPGIARISVVGRRSADGIEIRIDDDGRGVDLAAVRDRAVLRGLLSPGQAATASDAELIELLFLPGFSTRASADELSGRGIGLDVARAEVERLGGGVRVDTRPGRGTSLLVALPRAGQRLPVQRFLAAGLPVFLAVEASCAVAEVPTATGAIDPLRSLGVEPQPPMLASISGRADHHLQLRWAAGEITIIAGSAPVPCQAERLCAMPAELPFDVVAIDGDECLLLRPGFLR